VTYRPLLVSVVLLAGCGQPIAPPPLSLWASPASVGAQGGSVSLAWQGGTAPYLLSISSSSKSIVGVQVNGLPYSGPVSFMGSSAQVSFPPNEVSSSYAGILTYALILSSGSASKSINLTQQVSPFLAVANYGNATVNLYNLEGITNRSSYLTLQTGIDPIALAFDSQGNLWVGGGGGATAPSFLEEFTAPLTPNESPTFFSNHLQGSVLSLAFDPQGDLWIGENLTTIQEYSAPSSGLQLKTTMSTGDDPYLAFDASGNLWVGVAGNSPEILEYLAPLTSAPLTYPLTGYGGFGPIAFDAQGNLYSFNIVASTSAPLPLEELVKGASTFTQLFSVLPASSVIGLAFDASGNLWVSDSNSTTQASQVQEFKPPFSTGSQAQFTLTNGLNAPASLAIWPTP
jgi:hypothetical protein